jgi:HD-like signal output (HDOD) protein/DNA-binding NarL/FixJ family response regulator
MFTIVLIVQNPKETVFFRQIFLKVHFKLISSSPTYASYLKTLQYNPNIVIMEIPEDATSHLKFLRIIRGNKAIEQKPFIVYGPPCDEQSIKNILETGADAFLPRPLDLKVLLDKIGTLVKSASDSKNKIEEINQLSVDERNKLLDKAISKTEKLNLMHAHVGKLLAFPATVASILRVSQNEKSGAGELAQVIRSDPAMSAAILKIVNSVHFSRGGRRVLDMKDAVVRIGFPQTKRIAMSLSVFKISKNQNYATGFDHMEYWLHCLAVAIIAERIASTSRLVSSEEAFISGLLHDLGTLLFNEFFNDVFLKVLETSTDEGMRFIESENELMGFNHNELMGQLFTEWNFPEALCNDVQFMGRSGSLTKNFMSEHPLAGIVSVADIISKSYQLGRSVDCCIESVPNDIFENLRYPYGIQQAFLEKLYTELNMYNQILNIDKRVFPLVYDQIKDASSIRLLFYSFTGELFIPAFEFLKTQGYQVVLCRDLDELTEKISTFHAVVLTGASNENVSDITKLAALKTTPYLTSNTTSANDNPHSADSTARMLLFSTDDKIIELSTIPGIVTSRPSLDLRTIDIALRCLLFDLSTDQMLNTNGTLSYKKNADSMKSNFDKKRILIGHVKSEIRSKIRNQFDEKNDCIIEESNEGPKLVNLAKTLTTELHLVIIDLNIPFLSCLEVIKSIMTLPYHRRAKFVVMVQNAEKEQLIPLVKLGIRDFISEDASAEEIAKKIGELGF